MPKEFYTEKDIEDLVRRGVLSLEVGEETVLTDLAYEKANRLGLKLIRSKADNPPGAPIRPYLSEKAPASAQALTPSVAKPAPAMPAAQDDLSGRIRSAVLAKLGTQVDAAMLDTIIERVLNTTGLK